MPATMSLEELGDRSRITDTLYAYCDYVDTPQIDRLVDLFTEDAVIDMGQDARFTGRAELRSLLDRIRVWVTTNHYCANVRLVEYDGRSATTISSVYAYHDHPEQARTMHLWGRYLDELTKESGTWRIRERRLRVAGVSYTRSEPVPNALSASPEPRCPSAEPLLGSAGQRGDQHAAGPDTATDSSQ